MPALYELIEKHNEARKAHNIAKDDTPENDTSFEALINAEREIIKFKPLSVDDAAKKAVYLLNHVCTDSLQLDYPNDSGMEEADDVAASHYFAVRDLEATAKLFSKVQDEILDLAAVTEVLENNIDELDDYHLRAFARVVQEKIQKICVLSCDSESFESVQKAAA